MKETKAERLKRLCAERVAAAKEMHAIIETAEADNDGAGRSLTEDETALFKRLEESIPKLDDRIVQNQQVNEELLNPAMPRITEPEGRTATELDKGETPHPYADPPKPKVAAMPKHYGSLRYLKDPKQAWIAANWIGACLGNERCLSVCKGLGVEVRVHQEKVNTTGGYLVPDQLIGDIIDLKELHGVFPARSRRISMTSDTAYRPRRTGGLTATFEGESSAGTESTAGHDRVSLTAKKIMVLTRESNELAEDAMIDFGDFLVGEMSYAAAQKIDDCGFNGDGTSTFGGIVGVRNALLNLSSTIGNIAGLVVGAGNAYSEQTLANFHSVVGLLPQYAETPNVAWYCHKFFYATVMERLMYGAGGNAVGDLAAGTSRNFLGYPVVVSQLMPKVEGDSQVCCLLGDLSLGSMYGDRRADTVTFSEHATVNSVNVFEVDEFAIRFTTRFDINVHDVGNASGTAADRTQGPIVGLITAAS